MRPTLEQQAVIEAATWRKDLAIQAGAGTGKTSTLVMASSVLREPTVYVAYNKAIADDAGRRFPDHVNCRTAHSLAMRAVGRSYSHRLNSARWPSSEIADKMHLGRLDLSDADEELVLKPNQVARIVMDTVRRFCYSSDPEIDATHVPHQNGIEHARHAHLISAVLPLAIEYWADVINVAGKLPFEHDHYLKIWALTDPKLEASVVMLDEAQDTNPVLSKVIRDQTQAQQIVVGDSCQAMYSWRGAIDALAGFTGGEQLWLSQSWRFGDVIASEANKWLGKLDTRLALIGNPSIDSVLEPIAFPDAVLCRTNAGAMNEVMGLIAADIPVALVGGGAALARLANAAVDLQSGKRTNHPELYAFANWAAVRDYANYEDSGKDLLPFVKLIDAHGPQSIIAATKSLVDEKDARAVVSTVHKAKGREWGEVRLTGDFTVGTEGAELAPGEIMVNYVAVTRAKYRLDRGGLAWIDDSSDSVDSHEHEDEH